MFCDKCGGEIEAGSKFCRHCGAAQVEGPVADAPSPVPTESTSAGSKRQDKFAGRAIGVIAVIILAIVGLSSLSKNPTATAVDADALASNMEATADNMDAMADNMTAAAAVPATPAGNWSYSTDEDKVRGATTYYATSASTNQIYQSAPYDGGTTMKITVRKAPAYGTDVIFTISEGQMMCPSYEGCHATVSFDGGPAQRVSLNGPADNGSETVFVEGAKAFIAKLKKAKHVVIEKTLYQAGDQQFEFDVSGLKWDH